MNARYLNTHSVRERQILSGFYEPQESRVSGYVYRADTYCPVCTLTLLLDERGLEGHGLSPVISQAVDLIGRFEIPNYRDGEHVYDSDDFPKVILRPCDPEICGSCGEAFR